MLAGPDGEVLDDAARDVGGVRIGPASGPWGGMVADQLRVPYADHMLVPVPAGD